MQNEAVLNIQCDLTRTKQYYNDLAFVCVCVCDMSTLSCVIPHWTF